VAQSEATASHVTHDGVIRNPQATAETFESEAWDGRRSSYIPREPLAIDPRLELHTDADLDVDPITYQVLRSRFWHKNLEHGDVIQRVSGSVPVVYSRDYATALLTENGDVVTIGPTIVFFSTLADLIVKWTLENRSAAPGIEAGDVFLQNDPFIAAAQQSDTAFYAPVFRDGRLFCWVFNTLHVGDLGGVDPGGWAIHARDLFDESVTVPPIKVVERGTVRWDLVDAYVRQSREPDAILLNVKSALAGINRIRGELEALLDEFGPAVVKGVMRRMIAGCSRVVADRLARIPDGTWSERVYVTGIGGGRETHREVLTLSKRGDQVVCTNAGTSPQGGAGNTTYAFVRSSVVSAVMTALAWDQLGCTAGVANHVVFEPVPGTRNVARWPAACSGHLSTFFTLDLAALVTSKMLLSGPQELRERATALGGQSMPLADVVFGLDENGMLVATPASAGQGLLGGCIGAFPHRDGMDSAGCWWLVGSSAGNVETDEESGIFLVLFRAETRDSGAPGRWRGGNSITVGWTPHKVHTAAVQMTFTDPATNAVAGLAGGYYGLGGNFLRLGSGRVGELLREGRLPASRAQVEELAGPLRRLRFDELVLPVPAGDCIVVEFNGSGGYGDPIARDPELVRRDVEECLISEEAALRHYGVVLGDPAATERQRGRIREQRLGRPTAGARKSVRVVRAGVAGSADVASEAGQLVWACSSCGEPLGPVAANFKLAAARRELAPPEVDPHLYPDPAEFGDADIVLRQYCCPGSPRCSRRSSAAAATSPGTTSGSIPMGWPVVDVGGYAVGVDIGGTFTDCAIVGPDGSVRTGKVPTRPDDRARSFFEAIEEAAAKLGLSLDELLERCDRLVHGTTTGTNALITRTGVRVGLVTTAGHGDAIRIMKGFGRLAGVSGERMLDLAGSDKPVPLVARADVAEVVERIDFEGDVIVPLDEDSVLAALERLEGVEALTVSLLWSVRNDAHEQRVAALARERRPGLFVTAASEVAAQVGEYERTMTGVLNSHIGPLLDGYVASIEAAARARGFAGRIMYAQCAGGTITAAEARQAPIRTVHSGPVMGTLGSAFLAARMGEPDVIVTDMGGTSFDVSVIRGGSPDLRESSVVERFEIALPMVYVDSIGAGGGSIAWLDDAGGLQVGPQSAGADPGPACYGKGGTEATVTDADVVLGVVDPERFLHGAAPLRRDAAEAAIGRLAERLGLGLHETAAGINRIVDSKMADLLRRMSVLRGLDPRDFVCFAYGGMGPVHAGAVAREVGVKRLVVPLPHVAPVWSAFGATVADVVHIYERPRRLRMPADPKQLASTFAELERRGQETLAAEGFSAERIALKRSLRLKYSAQVFDVEVPLADEDPFDAARIAEDFARVYEMLHGEGSGHPEGGSEITGFVVRARGLGEAPALAPPPVATATYASRQVYWQELGGFAETPVLGLGEGRLEQELDGPLLVELPDTVVVLRPGQRARFSELGSLVIDV
jgi:N-methylhydantoinase A/oxoprolinase/acetone carboxylase beta subunit/N-methylhydantoinase B/oxoprolinase/acetone carboxylase alpha subunit